MRKSKKRLEMGEEKWAEYQRLRKNNKVTNYQIRNVDKVVYWRQRVKEKLIRYKGGKCEVCGYDKDCPNAYAFHHRDPSLKEIKIGGSTLSFERQKAEVEKCDLLCVRCHAEIHNEDFKQKKAKGVELLKQREENRLKPLVCVCGSVFQPHNRKQKTCSIPCSAKLKYDIKYHPTKTQLAEDIANLSWTAIGKKYGVSDNACRKWARKMGLIT